MLRLAGRLGGQGDYVEPEFGEARSYASCCSIAFRMSIRSRGSQVSSHASSVGLTARVSAVKIQSLTNVNITPETLRSALALHFP